MRTNRFPIRRGLSFAANCLVALAALTVLTALAQQRIPRLLEDWRDWATWDAKHRDCPTPYHDPARHFCFWPGDLSLNADSRSATWELEVTVFGTTWVPLPGGGDTWPSNVRREDSPVPVVERDGRPCVELSAGHHRIAGAFAWDGQMPQRVPVPREVGVLSLRLEGRKVDIPNWDNEGNLWLKRDRVEATDRDTIAAQVWRIIEDGIPLWLRTEIELSVSGKSREEELGHVVPQGWSVAWVEAPLPVAVDDEGRMKAQVRAGKWTIRVDAVRTTDAGEIRFAPDAQPVAAMELVGFRALPEFRMAQLEGLQVVDVSQTTFPEKWRNLPVYQWPTDRSFRLLEQMRGMGRQKPEGLHIRRMLWLDEDGRGLTFRDEITSTRQQIWRLDVAAGQELGAAKIGGQPQLITTNPATGAQGLEVRARNLELEAIGRTGQVRDIAATGWRSPADALQMALNLPPGWRLFAVFGADWVQGDWLTAWTLLDLFLLLIFSLAVLKLWGLKAGLVAFAAFGLAYHEPGAPRLSWLFLLLPLALLRVVPDGAARKWVIAWRHLALVILVLWLVPFFAQQIQGVLYPQLESARSYGSSPLFGRRAILSRQPLAIPAPPASVPLEPAPAAAGVERLARAESSFGVKLLEQKTGRAHLVSNLLYDAQAKIQTGPAPPEWSWNVVHCGWNGPVSADETLRPVFISLTLHRGLSLLRVALLLVLGGMLVGPRARRTSGKRPGAAPLTAAAVLLVFLAPEQARAQLPDKDMLNTLRERVLQPADAYPRAAEISSADLTLTDGGIRISAEIHAAVQVAVPIPGKLPSWSPVTVSMDGTRVNFLRRDEGYLWVVVPQGVHRLTVEGLIPGATEWEWTFLLKPRRVAIHAPGWTVTGVRPNGVPEDQVFFARQRQAGGGEVEYDRKDFPAVLVVDRHLEVGLIWQARQVVTRLSPKGKAVSLRVPLLAGEKVLSPNVVVADGFVEVRLGAGDEIFSWESELPAGEPITLKAAESDRWVERWHLVTSPVWHASLSGLAPVFETNEQNLVPVWHPWPGESVALNFRQPQAVSGDTITVQRVRQEIALGNRQRTTHLRLNVEASLGDDLVLELDPGAQVSALRQDDRALPVRREGARLMVPVHPGSQMLTMEWRMDQALGMAASADRIKLPVEAANITTVMRVPDSRWVLWAAGPQRGPAVRFWTVLAVSLLAAWVLGGLKLSPLRRFEWALLALGLTQVHFAAALIVVGWFFLLAWRGQQASTALRPWNYNLRQILFAGVTLLALGILVLAVREGLLGNPEMFIRGNGSTRTVLQWFEPRSGRELPMPSVLSVSVWYYRLLMLAWALWLAVALIRWLKWAWSQITEGGGWRSSPKKAKALPPVLNAKP
jgi:hypothetical protein